MESARITDDGVRGNRRHIRNWSMDRMDHGYDSAAETTRRNGNGRDGSKRLDVG